MFKKILSPVIYATFLAITFVGILAISYILAEGFNLSTRTTLIFAVPIVIFLLGTLLFWIANILISRLEKPNKPKIADHFRQSSLCYFVLVCILFYVVWLQIKHGSPFHPQFVYGAITSISTIIWAILVNVIFSHGRRKTNIT